VGSQQFDEGKNCGSAREKRAEKAEGIKLFENYFVVVAALRELLFV